MAADDHYVVTSLPTDRSLTLLAMPSLNAQPVHSEDGEVRLLKSSRTDITVFILTAFHISGDQV